MFVVVVVVVVVVVYASFCKGCTFVYGANLVIYRSDFLKGQGKLFICGLG